MKKMETQKTGQEYGKQVSFGAWVKEQREKRKLRQIELAQRLKARLVKQGTANAKVSRSLISMLEGDRLRPSDEVFNVIVAEFDVKNDDLSELRRLRNQLPVGATMEALGTSTRHMKAFQLAIDPDQETLHNEHKKVRDILDAIENGGRYLKLNEKGQIVRTGVAHTTASVTTTNSFLDRLDELEREVNAIEQLLISHSRLSNELVAGITSAGENFTTTLQKIRNIDEEIRERIERMKERANLYSLGKVIGQRGGRNLVGRNIEVTNKFIDSPGGLVAVLDAWDRHGGWGELTLESVQNREWCIQFSKSFLDVAETAERELTTNEEILALAQWWAGYLHGYIEEAIQLNATEIQESELDVKLDLPNRPKPESVEDDYWVDRVEVSRQEAATDTGASDSGEDTQMSPFIFKVIFRRDLV